MSTLIDALKKTLDAMETCSEPEVICYAEEIRGIIVEHERSEMIDYRESLQRLVDSIYGHFVPSAICKARDAAKELLAEHVEEDPTPWCSYCRARKAADCHCGPIAENE